jgi:P27 family predicted phage terminase small subunit
MAEEWDVIAVDLRDRKLLAKPMLGVLETYVVALWMARQAAEDIAANGLKVKTAHQADKANPATAVLKAAQISVARLAAELGITPASRSRAGMGGDKPATPDEDPLGLD